MGMRPSWSVTMFAIVSPAQWSNCAEGICKERVCMTKKPVSCTRMLDGREPTVQTDQPDDIWDQICSWHDIHSPAQAGARKTTSWTREDSLNWALTKCVTSRKQASCTHTSFSQQSTLTMGRVSSLSKMEATWTDWRGCWLRQRQPHSHWHEADRASIKPDACQCHRPPHQGLAGGPGAEAPWHQQGHWQTGCRWLHPRWPAWARDCPFSDRCDNHFYVSHHFTSLYQKEIWHHDWTDWKRNAHSYSLNRTESNFNVEVESNYIWYYKVPKLSSNQHRILSDVLAIQILTQHLHSTFTQAHTHTHTQTPLEIAIIQEISPLSTDILRKV